MFLGFKQVILHQHTAALDLFLVLTISLWGVCGEQLEKKKKNSRQMKQAKVK